MIFLVYNESLVNKWSAILYNKRLAAGYWQLAGILQTLSLLWHKKGFQNISIHRIAESSSAFHLPSSVLRLLNSETGYSFSPHQWLFPGHVRNKLLLKDQEPTISL